MYGEFPRFGGVFCFGEKKFGKSYTFIWNSGKVYLYLYIQNNKTMKHLINWIKNNAEIRQENPFAYDETQTQIMCTYNGAIPAWIYAIGKKHGNLKGSYSARYIKTEKYTIIISEKSVSISNFNQLVDRHKAKIVA